MNANNATAKIGVLGGSFQPVHMGHIAMAKSAAVALDLDFVLLVPVKLPPHKELASGANDDERYEMLLRACEDIARTKADDCELRREGKSYTVDTLRYFADKYSGAELYLLMGEDMIDSFADWNSPQAVARLAHIVAFPRGKNSNITAAISKAEGAFNARITLLPSVGDFSSTEIRERLKLGLPIRGYVPKAAEKCIYDNGLYLPHECRRIFDDMRTTLSEYRFRHTIGVWREAAYYAEKYGADGQKARIAALLHDCAKELSEAELRELLRHNGEPFNSTKALLHAPAGAIIAHEKYGINDVDILRAIALHTTADAEMTNLQKIICIADLTEDGRNRFPPPWDGAVEKIHAENDLNRAFLLALSRNLWYIKHRQFEPAPATLRAINEIRERVGIDEESL